MVPMAPSSTRMRSLAASRMAHATGKVLDAFITDELTISKKSCGSRRRAQRKRRNPLTPTLSPLGKGSALCLLRSSQTQQMAHRIDQVGAVHRVEMEIGDAAIDQ